MTVLQVERLMRGFDGQPVLRGVGLSVAAGEIAVLVGASGSGKTTLLRIIAGLERADGGCVRLRGQVVEAPPKHRPVPPERRGLGMVFQEHALWPHLTAQENVALVMAKRGAMAKRGTAAARAAIELLEAMELGAFADRRPATLSGGQQQRVALARALATGSDLVLLDEPLSSLDETVRDRLRPLIRDRLRGAGRAALMVSHDRVDAWRVADRLLVLEDGMLAQSGPPQALYAAPASLTVARYMGAEGSLRVWGTGPGRVRTCDGHELAACSALAPGAAGTAVAHPDGVRLGMPGGMDAMLQDAMFEAGQWRTRWRVGDGGEMLGLHDAPPPPHSKLAIDPAKLFAFPA